MTKEEKYQLSDLLTKLMIEDAPCHNGACVGYQNCELGCCESYGETCSVENVLNYLTFD